MYKYVCSIEVAEECCGSFTLLEDIILHSEHHMSRRDIRTQVINRVPDKYTTFGVDYITYQGQVDEY